jgi:hypothetical protein
MSSHTHANGIQQENAGQVILLVAATVAGLLVIAGLVYATGTGARDQASLTAAGCEPGLSGFAAPCTTQPMLASEYKAVFTPASQQLSLDTEAYAAHEGRNLTAAEAALSAEAAAEQAFDTNLAGIKMPPAATPIARALIRADQSLATLTARQARAATLTQMRSYNPRVQAATAAVETQLNLILKAVDAPVRGG